MSSTYYESIPLRSDSENTVVYDDEATNRPWSTCIHPQGWIYFFNAELKVVTDDDIRQDDIAQRVHGACNRYPLAELDDGMEVHLYGNSSEVYNLAVNHDHCIASYDIQEVKPRHFHKLDANSLNRKRRLYWIYLGNHPAHVPTPNRAVSDAFEALTWFYTDNLISGQRSVVPFSKPECEDLLRLLKNMTLPQNDNSKAKTVFVAWILREVASFRVAEAYGVNTVKQSNALREARKPRTSPIAPEPSPWALRLFSIVINVGFFSIPWTYLAHVKTSSEYRGRLAGVQRNWEAYIERLVREYSHFLLITVLLSATVGLLAIPDIQSAGRIAAIVSAFTSLGSIIFGVFCIWTHQTNTHARDSFSYMYNAQHAPFGLYGHALILSLPPVLLVWAILMFSVSVIAYTLQNPASTALSRGAAWAVLGVCLVIFIAVGAGVYTLAIVWRIQSRGSRFSQFWISMWRRGRSKEIG